jgi:P-type Mg2+ transporter
VESLLTQILIIHLLRTARIPVLQSRASVALSVTTALVCAVGIALPYISAGAALGFVPLPPAYWPVVVLILLGYAALTQVAKTLFVRRYSL